ncbi:MAG: restriction endonuclease subunit S [Sumerlaeia bacterium]
MSTSIPVSLLGDLITIKGGGTPSRHNPAYWGGNIPWATVKDLQGSELSAVQESITEEGLQNSASQVIEAGHVITATRMALGRAAIATKDVAINQDLKALVAGPQLYPRYLLHFIISKGADLERMGKGATVKGILIDDLKKLQIPLPPLTEQRRIAAILDKADTLRRKAQQALNLTDDLIRSTFLDMFGDPVTNPKGWPMVRLGDMITEIRAGKSVGGEQRQRAKDEWAVLKISAVTSGRFLPHEHKVVNDPPAEETLVRPKKGDLIFSRANTRELVAAMAIVEENTEGLFLPDKLWTIETNPKQLRKEYLKYLMADPLFRSKFATLATGTSGSMLNVSQKKLIQYEIPTPDPKLQDAFADFTWGVFKTRNRLAAQCNESDATFEAALQRAFMAGL